MLEESESIDNNKNVRRKARKNNDASKSVVQSNTLFNFVRTGLTEAQRPSALNETRKYIK